MFPPSPSVCTGDGYDYVGSLGKPALVGGRSRAVCRDWNDAEKNDHRGVLLEGNRCRNPTWLQGVDEDVFPKKPFCMRKENVFGQQAPAECDISCYEGAV